MHSQLPSLLVSVGTTCRGHKQVTEMASSDKTRNCNRPDRNQSLLSLDSDDEDDDVPEYLPEASALKPKLDLIFTDVVQSLPDIDFDGSDVSIITSMLC